MVRFRSGDTLGAMKALRVLFSLLPGLLLPLALQAATLGAPGPHGGTLVPIGERFAHLEVVLSPLTGVLRVYVLDREARGGIRLGERSLHLKIRQVESEDGRLLQGPSVELELNPVSNASTGETVGDTSEFAGQANALVGAARFEALLRSIRLWGSKVQVTYFEFPSGHVFQRR